MFCMNCGKSLPDGAKFCNYCGTPQNVAAPTNSPQSVINIDQSTKLVPGTCTNCGASLQVNPDLKTAICPACGTPYIVQQAINNFNIHSTGNIRIENAVISVPGANAKNYVLRAVGLEQQFELEKALEYYNKALDIDASNRNALISVARINELLDDYCYKVGRANLLFSSGKLMLKKDKLIYVTDNGKETTHNLSAMTDIKVHIGCLEFIYGGNKDWPISYGGENTGDWVAVLTNAKEGDYPRITKETIVLQPNYKKYHENLTKFLSAMGMTETGMTDVVNNSGKRYSVMLKSFGNSKMGIISVYKDFKLCGLKEAKDFVESLPGVIMSTASLDEANGVAKLFEQAGAVVEIFDSASSRKIEHNDNAHAVINNLNSLPSTTQNPINTSYSPSNNMYSSPVATQNASKPASPQGNSAKKGIIGGIIALVILIIAVRGCFYSCASRQKGPTSVGVYNSSLLSKGEDIILDSEYTVSNASYRVPDTWRYKKNNEFMYFYPDTESKVSFLMVNSKKADLYSINDSVVDGFLEARAKNSNKAPVVIKREIEQNGNFYLARLDYNLTLEGRPYEFAEFIILDKKAGILYFFSFVSENSISDENMIYFNEITRSIVMK